MIVERGELKKNKKNFDRLEVMKEKSDEKESSFPRRRKTTTTTTTKILLDVFFKEIK